MRRRIRNHLTYANVTATVALFVAVGGGSALAAIVISSNSQVARGTISGHKPPSGKHPNLIAGSINGDDIADHSGVETCNPPLTKRYGRLCVGSDGAARDWPNSLAVCAAFGLRLPTLGEAVTLARRFDVPGVPNDPDFSDHYFWTDGRDLNPDTHIYQALAINDDGGDAYFNDATPNSTVCVTDPAA
jgi:hypothetical protein